MRARQFTRNMNREEDCVGEDEKESKCSHAIACTWMINTDPVVVKSEIVAGSSPLPARHRRARLRVHLRALPLRIEALSYLSEGIP